MTKIIVKIITVVLGLGRLSAANVVKSVESIVGKMTANTHFPDPDPELTVITTENTELRNAIAVAENGTKAQRAVVKVKRRALMLSMNTLRAYVETIANADPKSAEAIALSSGMGVKRMTLPPDRTFKVKNTLVSGEVMLTCPKGKKQYGFNYCYTLTPDMDSSWIAIGAMPKVTRTVDGLIVGRKYYFRFASITKDGQSGWSDAISIIVT